MSRDPRDRVDLPRQVDVLLRDPTAGVVGVEPEADRAVDVPEFGMVVGRLGREGDADDERDRLAKAPELELPLQRIAVPAPAGQPLKGVLNLNRRRAELPWGRNLPRRPAPVQPTAP